MHDNGRPQIKTYNYYASSYRRLEPAKPPKSPKRQRKFTFKRFALLICLLIALVSAHTLWTREVQARDLSRETTAKAAVEAKAEQYSAMESTINSVISSNSDITFDVAITDLSNNTQQNFGQDEPMEAASVSKILTATDFLRQVELGQESMNENINGDTASDELQQMIVVSDDTSWEDLNNELSYSQLQTYADSLGLTSYNWQNNTLSAQDTNTLLEKLYQGSLLNSTDTQLILSYMKTANYRNIMVPVVPNGYAIYHKVGEVDDNVNEAAIVTNGKNTVLISVYTDGNGNYDWTAREKMIQQIAQVVFNYYLN